RALAQAVIGAGKEVALAEVLVPCCGVVAAQVMHVTKTGIRADDRQALRAGHRLHLELQRASRRRFRRVELAVQRLEEGELQKRVTGLRVQGDGASEMRDRF